MPTTSPATRHLSRRPSLARDLLRASYIVAPALAIVAVAALLLAVVHPRGVPGHATAGEAVITITSHAQVHSAGRGDCYVRTPQHYSVTLLGGGTREGSLSPGRLASDGSCVFSTTLPALSSATEIVVNGGEHAIRTGAGTIALSSDDGQWVPLKTGDL